METEKISKLSLYICIFVVHCQLLDWCAYCKISGARRFYLKRFFLHVKLFAVKQTENEGFTHLHIHAFVNRSSDGILGEAAGVQAWTSC